MRFSPEIQEKAIRVCVTMLSHGHAHLTFSEVQDPPPLPEVLPVSPHAGGAAEAEVSCRWDA